MKRSFQLAFLRTHGLEPHHRLVDLGCGTLRGGIPIINYLDADNYVGIDVRPKVIAEARKELRESELEHKQPRLIAASLTEMNGLDADFLWAFSVLFHMDDADLEECFGFASRCTATDGVFYANVLAGPKQRSGTWSNFPVMFRPLSQYEAVARRHHFGVKDLGALKDLGHVSGDEKGDNQRMLAFHRRRSPAPGLRPG